MILAIRNFLKDINFTDQTVCRPGIQLDFEACSINSPKTSSTRSSNLKRGAITRTQLVNNSIRIKVKQINFSADNKKCAKIRPFLELELKTLQIFLIKP